VERRYWITLYAWSPLTRALRCCVLLIFADTFNFRVFVWRLPDGAPRRRAGWRGFGWDGLSRWWRRRHRHVRNRIGRVRAVHGWAERCWYGTDWRRRPAAMVPCRLAHSPVRGRDCFALSLCLSARSWPYRFTTAKSVARTMEYYRSPCSDARMVFGRQLTSVITAVNLRVLWTLKPVTQTLR